MFERGVSVNWPGSAAEVDELCRLIEVWKERLRLMDWRIDVNAQAPHKIEPKDAYATCAAQPEIQFALIAIGWPPAAYGAGYSLEQTVIHELIHAVLSPVFKVWEHLVEDAGPFAGPVAVALAAATDLAEVAVDKLACALRGLSDGDQNNADDGTHGAGGEGSV